MATFEVKIHKLIIEDHPNADNLELAVVGDYRSIVMKGQYESGDLGVYIPEAAILPDWAIKRLGLEGRLAGKDKNRVKAIKLRKILSQGLIFPVELRKNVYNTETHKQSDVYVLSPHEEGGAGISVTEGGDVMEFLGITKYEPKIPTAMNGEVFNAFGMTLKYDIENIKRFPDVLEDGEQISITEKLHGTWCCIGNHPDVDDPIITSKGLSEKGLAFKINEANTNNLYVKTFNTNFNGAENGNGRYLLASAYNELFQFGLIKPETPTPIYMIGEIFGEGVQDLHYGLEKPEFRLFDIYVGVPGEGKYLSPLAFKHIAENLGMNVCPELYVGAYSKEIVEQYTNGKDTLSETHVREGVVIKPIVNRRDHTLGRVFLKSISDDYLLRKGKKGETPTEFN